MMKVWVMQGSYEGELFSSVHLTQKGCALACISDITEFLDIDDEESAVSMSGSRLGEEEDGAEPIEWDQEKLKEMTSEQLWKVFGEWCEISWDRMSDRSYHIDGSPAEIQA